MSSLSFALLAYAHVSVLAAPGISTQAPDSISVAAVQFQPRGNVEDNTKVIIEFIKILAKQDIRVAVFQECAITGYDKEVIDKTTAQQLLQAEEKIAEACKANHIYAIVGTPHESEGVIYNTAVVFDPNGKEIERYAKMQLVGGDDWAEPGNVLSVFKIDGIPCSIIICHDERYPELVRLPVLAGARLVFYISSESNIKAESKIEPYRAQICARAVENNIFIVQSNSPAMLSHGQSRIIAPDGNIIVEATMFKEEFITATLNMKKANGNTAKNSLRSELLKSWWQDGVKKVIVRD